MENGLACKRAFRDGSSRTRHAYVLTQNGRDLAPVILAPKQWVDKHMKDGPSARALTDTQSGVPIEIGIARAQDALPLSRLTYKVKGR
ncbi:hypothetical protein [Tateyamaria omphalii]|uniref:Uncharacterized protein n=1 Tax=Tateyamaria omphalii TaxID=299262 RepID=A0A1P8MRJ5_9RHOB|nr:hypothetical protein [Tateyamaria omphalii]APX10700.1 hypothetical protein BWR18_02575 [Tateyamaria omphalii]